jgi:light-regulated signal transduction histidine kinase (bacteriophytochrome)
VGEGGCTAYHVRDEPAGFDEVHAGILVAAFQRLRTAEEVPGTGIGLGDRGAHRAQYGGECGHTVR